MSQFFIDRPIFAWVIAIVIMLAGVLAIRELPIAQYPAIAPPEISIDATYPGASAQTVENTVTQVIEQKMNGIDHLRYMSSTSDSNGSVSITLTFDEGTNPDIAQVQVQNKLQLAVPLLPQTVQQQGIQVTKSTRNFLMVLAFVSEDDSMNQFDLSDYLASNVQDTISRIEGVGDVQMFGAQYAMRIWLNPDKLNNYKLTATDVTSAIKAQNVQVSAGQLGGMPYAAGQQLNATVTAQTLLQTPKQFGAILLRTLTDGSSVYLRDVAGIEIGSENYSMTGRYNGKPATGLAIKLASGANALTTADGVRAKMQEMQKYFPQGLKVVYPYDSTPFVRISIEEVVKTLLEAIVLVFLVMFLFLQNFRATLIPTIAVPVVLLGTFAVLDACGFSINTLTMFGMVLAIGLLVDDAIVVVENVERVMSEEGLSPKEATRKSMNQITSALVGIAMVLAAVFVPMAFFGGSTGVIYRQFSITIVSAMALSVAVALILTPALCSTMLKPVTKGHQGEEKGLLSGFFRRFNRIFNRTSAGYQSVVTRMMDKTLRCMAVYLLVVVGMGVLFWRMPTSYLPDEDQGMLYTMVQLPVGATQDRTIAVLKKVEHYFLVDQKDAVNAIFTAAGFSFAGSGQNTGIGFVQLRDWKYRQRPDLKVFAVVANAMKAFSHIHDAMVYAFAPPAVRELATSNGFDFELQDRAGLGHAKLMEARNQLLGMAARDSRLVAVRPNGQNDTPQFKVDIDQEKACALGLSLADINDTLSTAWGGAYVNDFINKGRIKKVYVQADAPYRMQPEDLYKWYVRNHNGDMVPFSAFSRAYWTYGSPRLERYNGMPSMEILGQPAPGVSSGVAMQEMEKLTAKLPPGIGYEWTGLSYQERLAGSQAPALYAFSIIFIFLCVAALYESWTIPFVNLLMLPLGLLGAVVATSLRGLPNDVYFQIGFLTTLGLSTKNAILIIQFIKERLRHGDRLIDATLGAVKTRFRPVIMTSLAFFFGVLPLAIASAAGAGAMNAVGTAVCGGMLSATFIDLMFIPLFFVLVSRIFKREQYGQIPASVSSQSAGVSAVQSPDSAIDITVKS
jgi:multidrug efflux pump